MDVSDIVGARFGRLLVLEVLEVDKNRNRPYRVKCDCGTIKSVVRGHLTWGHTISCGCHRLEAFNNRQHGDAKDGKRAPEWVAWVNMKARCKYPSHNRFEHYGGRGIKVCQRWLDSYENFLKDMGRKPSAEHSLDRINVNGNYIPSNCRWATRHEQATNKQRRS